MCICVLCAHTRIRVKMVYVYVYVCQCRRLCVFSIEPPLLISFTTFGSKYCVIILLCTLVLHTCDRSPHVRTIAYERTRTQRITAVT